MLILLSPAKTIDFDGAIYDDRLSNPRLSQRTLSLVDVLKTKSKADLKALMKVSDKLADENYLRYQTFDRSYNKNNSRAAASLFRGGVYQGLEFDSLSEGEQAFANTHLRILSGLYGVLRPLDRIQPYRLEMGTRLDTDRGTNLYQFWDEDITKVINRDLSAIESDVIINLASKEYFSALSSDKLKATVINVEFKEVKDGKLKFVSFFAKKARGLMARYIVKNSITSIDEVKGFDMEGYQFDKERSTAEDLLFVR